MKEAGQSKSEVRQIPHDTTYMQNLKYEPIYEQKQTHRHRDQTYSCQEGGKDWEFGISICKPVSIEWTNSKVLWWSTGNHTQYPVINHNGKEYEKEDVYTCITISLCCTPETNTTL